MRYSVIIPCYKSDQTIEHVVDMTRDEMIRLGKGDVEFVLVNDCSPDGGKTIRKLREMAQKHADVKVIGLAKNSGQHNALMAALRHAEGDIIIGMDDDGQTHPSQLSKLLGALDEGYDLVYGYYPEKKHNWFRNLGSRFNDLTVNMMIKKPKEVRTSSYFVVRKFVRDYTIQYEGSYTYLLGLFMRCTQNIASVPVQHFERESGESGYTLGQLIRLWSSIIGFSVIPLRIASIAGFFFAGVGLLMALFVLIRKCIDPNMSIGWPSLMCAISFFFGLNFMFLGMIGEYLGRMFLGMNKEPQYVIKETYNIPEEKGLHNKKSNRPKILILLSLSLIIQSLSSVFIKYAGTYETLSKEFIFFYVLAVGALGIFAIMWQLLLELIPLTTAYLRKGILYILILLWSVLLFKEHVTINNIIGSIIIIAGISLHGMDEH